MREATSMLKRIQQSIRAQLEHSDWFYYPDKEGRALDIAHAVTGLNEEAGEVAGLLKKQVFRHKDRSDEQWLSELGDVLWYLTAVTILKGFTLSQVWEFNCNKLEQRRATGIKGNESWEG